MSTHSNELDSRHRIKSIIGNKIAIEQHIANRAFEAFAFVARVYFESLGIKVIRFYRKPPTIFQVIKYKIVRYIAMTQKYEDYAIPSLLTVLKWKIKALFYSIKTFSILLFRLETIFNLKIDDVKIGEQLASDIVRFSSSVPTRYSFGINLIRSLIDFHATYQYGKYLIFTEKADSFLVSHLVYSWSVYSKIAIRYKKKYLYLGNFPYSILVSPDHNNPYYPFILTYSKKRQYTDKERELAKEYMKKRTSNDNKLLPYMGVSAYSSDEGPLLKNLKNKGYKEINCCLFLHSFSDALFVFGHDSFNDIWDWTSFTIQTLLQKKNVKIFIKPHPNVFHKDEISSNVLKKDFNTFNFLLKKYSKFNNIEFLPHNTSNNDIISMPNFIGITHHGNIATELAFLGKPVVSSMHSPWKFFNDFTICWKDKKDYIDILNNIDNYINFVPNELNLYDFVYRYHIEPNLIIDNKFYGNRLFEIAFNSHAKSHLEVMVNGKKILSSLKNDPKKMNMALSLMDRVIHQAIINSHRG